MSFRDAAAGGRTFVSDRSASADRRMAGALARMVSQGIAFNARYHGMPMPSSLSRMPIAWPPAAGPTRTAGGRARRVAAARHDPGTPLITRRAVRGHFSKVSAAATVAASSRRRQQQKRQPLSGFSTGGEPSRGNDDKIAQIPRERWFLTAIDLSKFGLGLATSRSSVALSPIP